MKSPKIVKKSVVFSLNMPEAESVLLAGSFTNWGENPLPLKKQKSGVWKVNVRLEPGTYEYKFIVDGNWVNDPECSMRNPNPYGGENCVICVE
jgi:1,4-alpha-glucan branching enzyme